MADLPAGAAEVIKQLGAFLAEAGFCVVPIAEWEELQALRAKVAAEDLTRETERLGLYDATLLGAKEGKKL